MMGVGDGDFCILVRYVWDSEVLSEFKLFSYIGKYFIAYLQIQEICKLVKKYKVVKVYVSDAKVSFLDFN